MAVPRCRLDGGLLTPHSLTVVCEDQRLLVREILLEDSRDIGATARVKGSEYPTRNNTKDSERREEANS